MDGLEQALRDLPRIGTLVKDRGYRQVWRFEASGRAYFLKFYHRHGFRDRFRRSFRGSPAMAEFTKLKWLQRAAIPAPRAVAVLMGFRIEQRVGDAVILEAIEPSVQLDRYFNELELRGEPIPDHLKLATQIRELVQQLAQAGYGHEDLHLGNFLLREGKLFLLDGYAVRRGGLKLRHLLMLGNSVRRYATVTDLLRGWYQLGPPGRSIPINNPITAELADTFISRRLTTENRYFGRLAIHGWVGSYFKHDKYPRRWSPASHLDVTAAEWERALSDLLAKLDADQFQVLKRSRSGDVLAAEVTLAGRSVPIIIKRPRRRYWYRYVNEIGRGSRARRAWYKAWHMVLRNFPTAWPLLFLERRTAGYVTDSLIVFERVPGPTFPRVNLDEIEPVQRDMLFRRTGRILRNIEREGFAHFDAKASNWIIRADDRLGPGPILIDVDGIRRRRWIALGIQRLLKSLHENRQYSPADSYALCKGYAPAAPLYVEETPADELRELASPARWSEDQSTRAAAHGTDAEVAPDRPAFATDPERDPSAGNSSRRQTG